MERAATRAPCPVASEVSGEVVGCVGDGANMSISRLARTHASHFPSDTLARENPPGEGTASEWGATDICPKPSKMPNPHNEDLQEAGGEPSVLGDSPVFLEDIEPCGLARVAENADVGGVEPSGIDAYERAPASNACSLTRVSFFLAIGLDA